MAMSLLCFFQQQPRVETLLVTQMTKTELVACVGAERAATTRGWSHSPARAGHPVRRAALSGRRSKAALGQLLVLKYRNVSAKVAAKHRPGIAGHAAR